MSASVDVGRKEKKKKQPFNLTKISLSLVYRIGAYSKRKINVELINALRKYSFFCFLVIFRNVFMSPNSPKEYMREKNISFFHLRS